MHVDLGFIDNSDIQVKYLTGNPEDWFTIYSFWASLLVTMVA
jgi:hypothetical protein